LGRVPLADDEVPSAARDLTAMVGGFATAGPRHWRARRRPGRREAWLARLVEGVRSGAATVPDGSVVDVVARHRDAGGERLDPRTAAVEVLNVIRPTVAISWFLAFSGHALARWPQYRDRLASGDPAFAEAWADEVRASTRSRRSSAGARRARSSGTASGCRSTRWCCWTSTARTTTPACGTTRTRSGPERFLGREVGAFELVPQGGGDPRTGHRCPGERVTVAVLSALASGWPGCRPTSRSRTCPSRCGGSRPGRPAVWCCGSAGPTEPGRSRSVAGTPGAAPGVGAAWSHPRTVGRGDTWAGGSRR
jgi:fatty-acid peroxygenase